MSEQRYALPAILMHWVQAGLVFWLLWLGMTMVELPKGAERSAAYGLHKSLGLLVLGLTFVRFAWRRRSPPPAQPVGGMEARVARAVHHALYLWLLLVPLTGYLATCFTSYPLKFFGLEIVKLGWPDESLNAAFKQAHVFFTFSMFGLLALHVAGAFRHGVKRDSPLRRMLPFIAR